MPLTYESVVQADGSLSLGGVLLLSVALDILQECHALLQQSESGKAAAEAERDDARAEAQREKDWRLALEEQWRVAFRHIPDWRREFPFRSSFVQAWAVCEQARKAREQGAA